MQIAYLSWIHFNYVDIEEIRLYSLALWNHHVNLLLHHHVNFLSVSLDLHQCSISTVEDPSLRIESFAIINLHCVSTKVNYYCIRYTQTYTQGTYKLDFVLKYNILEPTFI